ncbi:beta-ketoacyl synthase domain-containing protein [Colletotrichum graminicola M1.001]|uniref:Beta-ketoacyl synthase domain-containing protein n=1 Tax=Colletotrichum graminicola (strain M1.001 / M2 / FGSC 10212) TaxID=645133 RepID=E3QZW9_COLGM|nr:beta-ketoacyl synthase domain-containing protein [Colletotrichum graminicola M1.001]EFQ36407.1 beta-ketoacyl synthase domain-containing protein [Colletotrichum graminicola M1.001]
MTRDGRLCPEKLSELRTHLTSDVRLSELLHAAQDLHKFWSRAVHLDPELTRVPAESYLHGLSEWLVHATSFPCSSPILPAVLALPLNLLFQLTQYLSFLQSVDEHGENSQRLLLEGLENGGVQGFCVGFLSAITVASSNNVQEIFETAKHALQLAVIIGAYVDKDAMQVQTKCISVRGRQQDVKSWKNANSILQAFPEAYVSAITGKTSITVTCLSSQLDILRDILIGAGYTIQDVPVYGRLHCAVYNSEVKKIMGLFNKIPDLRFPTVADLRVPVRSATNGSVITQGDLVQHVLNNTLLMPVEWYATTKLAVASLPPRHEFIALAGASDPLPLSLAGNMDVRHITIHGLTKQSIGCPSSDFPSHSVAIVGIAGRFPGANSVDELWELLLNAKSMVDKAPTRVGLDQLDEDVSQVKWWGNFLDDYDSFDHKFFNKSSREAMACDPQQRKLFEVVYEALESSGQLGADALSDCSDYGCYIGAVMNNYVTNVSCHPPTAYATTGTGRSFLSGAVSHHFGWTGPALTVDTACSSSLVAIHMACRAIATGECSRAVAGGTNIITSPHDYRDLKAAGFLSPTGQCKPFDAGADGYCRGEAVCVVVLKSLASAIAEGDEIIGVVVGSATSQNDNEGPIVVPNAKSQASLLTKVMNMSNVVPEDITYVEAHGTGTEVGDPIEVSSIREAFSGPSRKSKLRFASIKGNIGHVEAASGAAGLIKAILMMRHGKIPPQASYRSLNPRIPALEPDGMEIPQVLTDWGPAERIACINNYGAAGSNAAIMIRQAPVIPETTDKIVFTEDSSAPSSWPLVISASTRVSLSFYCQKLLDWLRRGRSNTTSDFSIADIVFNLSRRTNHALRNIVSTPVPDLSALESVLCAVISENGPVSVTPSSPPPVILLFGGQESRCVGLSRDIWRSSHILRYHLDHCQDLLLSLGLGGIYPDIFQQTPLTYCVTLHLALFSLQYSCAKAWMDCGLQVAAVIGHSFGQLTALCISGVLSLSDALTLVAGRASLIEKHWGSEAGAMISLQADEQRVADILKQVNAQIGYAEVACYNGPQSHVIVGSLDAIRGVEALISSSDQFGGSIRSQRLNNTHGFHSKFTEPLLPYLADLGDKLDWGKPLIHIEVCSETQNNRNLGTSLVVEHSRRPVYFKQAVQRLMKKYPQATWLEAGRGSSYTQLVQACAQHPNSYSFVSTQLTTSNAQNSLVNATVKMWKEGHCVQFWPFHRTQRRQYRHLSLPIYQFQKTRHWLSYTRATTAKKESSTVQHGEPKDPEMLSFVTGDKSTEAVFCISTSSKRFQSLVMGHFMCRYGVMPASAYIEVASRAALMLQGDSQATNWTPTVEDLAMRAPVVFDLEHTSPDIKMILKRLDKPTHPSWSFSIFVTAKDGAASVETQETTVGFVHLRQRSDSQAIQEFRRLDDLIGQRRWEQVINHPDAEGMRGNHIYRAFSQIVKYSEAFQGIKTIASMGNEAAGIVKTRPDTNDPPDQRLVDTPMIDSFMQFGGFLVNYFNQQLSAEELFVCHFIQRLQIGPGFSPDAGDWIILANTTLIDKDNISVDVYVSEKQSGKTILTSLGMDFKRISRASLAQILGGSVNESDLSRRGSVKCIEQTTPICKPTTQPDNKPKSKSRRVDVIQIIADVADVPEEELDIDTRLADIAIDSLGATEIVGDIATKLGVIVDLTTFSNFEDISAIVAHVDSHLGLQCRTENDDEDVGIGNPSPLEPQRLMANGLVSNQSCEETENSPSDAILSQNPAVMPAITSIDKLFDDVRLSFDELGAARHALEYWSDIYPDDKRLILAYTVEAFKNLGCDLKRLRPGQPVPEIVGFLPRHQQLVNLLHQFLKEENIIILTGDGVFSRTSERIETATGETIFNEILGKHPHNAAIRQLLHAVGPHLEACLIGTMDALQILFGNRANKKWLDEVYRDWPMLVTATQLLGDFLCRAFTQAEPNTDTKVPRKSCFRVLEVGAGTGGTTSHIVSLLKDRGIPFEYHFTDISPTLVQKAKSSFKGISGMSFGVMDIEKEPEVEFIEAFHVIISTNCIHATRNISLSLANLRKMLRQDGALALIEMTPTRPLYVFDVIVGLLEGWWLFEDGRKHALASIERWEQAFMEAGFRHVLWSDGPSLEARTVRVVCGFQSQKTAATRDHSEIMATANRKNTTKDPQTGVHIQEVVYKKVGSQNIHADIYCPHQADPTRKMPIALMIHGGSHVLFSRKDVRDPQTRIMLDMGLLPVSLDHRLCPETRLAQGPMVDVCDAVEWARVKLPHIKLANADVKPDPDNLVVIGWSSGGQLALSTGWTTLGKGIRPPNAILAFYCPTDYEDDWWRNPIQPIGAADQGQEYDVLEAVQEEPITNYGVIGAWKPLSDQRIHNDPRARIVLHMNWKAQTLPVVISGLPSKSSVASESPGVNWNALPQPPVDEIQRCSPLAQVRKGNYVTPTFIVHGEADDLIPWQQSLRTIEEIKQRGIDGQLVLVPGAPHICDTSRDSAAPGWQAVLDAYQWLMGYAFSNK